MIDSTANYDYNLFCDGGVITRNPSPYGGTYAWILVDNKGTRINHDNGFFSPESIGKEKVSNNASELYAVLQALEFVLKEYPNYQGHIWTDSMITWRRLTKSFKFNGIPDFMRLQCLQIRRNGLWIPKHLGGHPTLKDLAMGYDNRGLPVSVHNVSCDNMCKKQSAKFLSRMNIKEKH